MKIILVTVDCLRVDALEHMPKLSRLAKEHNSYSKVYANSSYTVSSLKSLLTSTYPLDGGLDFPNFNSASFVESLNHVGDFFTLGFHSNPWMSFYKAYRKGFDHFEDVGITGKGIAPARRTLDKSKGLIDSKEKVFSWFHFMDLHDSAEHGNDWKKLPFEERYKLSLQGLDDVMQEVFDIGDLVILTADHGEELGERGRYGHFSRTPGIPETLLRVPLVIKSDKPGLTSFDGRFSLINIAPTILDYAGVDIPATFKGKSLFDFDENSEKLVVSEIPRFVKHFGMEDTKNIRQICRSFIVGDNKIVVETSLDNMIINMEVESL